MTLRQFLDILTKAALEDAELAPLMERLSVAEIQAILLEAVLADMKNMKKPPAFWLGAFFLEAALALAALVGPFAGDRIFGRAG